MKNYRETVGIDVSKKTLDVYCYNLTKHKVFTNTVKGYLAMIRWVNNTTFNQSTFYCFENTGNYSLKLAIFLSENNIPYVEESPIKIKRSSGLIREKSDKTDAYIIARYAWLHREELAQSKIKSKTLQQIGRLLALRDQLVKNRAGLLASLKEFNQLLNSPSTDTCCIVLKRTITNLDKQVKAVENQMKLLVEQDYSISQNFKLLLSLKGVGLVVAIQLIYHTENFNRFANSRKFSNYCGLAPFEYSSGTSVHKRKQCHYLGDRKMKSLLSMAAVSAIQHDPELKRYYRNKIEQGKPKMIALNNVRNKIIARAFSVVKRKTPYVTLNNFAA